METGQKEQQPRLDFPERTFASETGFWQRSSICGNHCIFHRRQSLNAETEAEYPVNCAPGPPAPGGSGSPTVPLVPRGQAVSSAQENSRPGAPITCLPTNTQSQLEEATRP